MRAGLSRAGVPVWLETPLTGLVITDGRVTGVEATKDGQPVVIKARRGVLIATGGFERNAQMRAEYQRQPIGIEWTVGSPGNTGDGIVAGQEAGAGLDLMDDAWWGPSIPLTGGPYFCLAERSLPGSIIVNGVGQRFSNEAAPYVDAVHAMYDRHTADKPHIPAWMITDQRYRNNYVFAGLPPRKSLPRRWFAAGVVFKAGTLAELAEQIKLPADGLTETVRAVQRVREVAARTRTSGGATRPMTGITATRGAGRIRTWRALDLAPFYAIKIVPGRSRDQGRAADRRAGAGAAAGRQRDRRAVRGRERQRGGDGAQLRRRGRDDRTGHDVRLHRRARHGGRAALGIRAGRVPTRTV